MSPLTPVSSSLALKTCKTMGPSFSGTSRTMVGTENTGALSFASNTFTCTATVLYRAGEPMVFTNTVT